MNNLPGSLYATYLHHLGQVISKRLPLEAYELLVAHELAAVGAAGAQGAVPVVDLKAAACRVGRRPAITLHRYRTKSHN